MDNVILPEAGSVVIIDEQPTEALPLIEALSKKGISATYYKGIEADKFPEKPCQVVRIVFLDLKLYTSTDERTIGRDLVSKLQKIIGPENGPYILVIWSKHEGIYAKYLKDEINKPENKIIPSCIVSLEKSECLEQLPISDNSDDVLEKVKADLESRFPGDDMEYILKSVAANLTASIEMVYQAKHNAVEIIEKNIRAELDKAGAFHLFVLWENVIKRSSAQMIKQVSGTVPVDSHWEGNMRSIFYQMGKARVSKSESNSVKILRESIKTFNYSFIDSVERTITGMDFPNNVKLDNAFLLTIQENGISYSLKRDEKHKYSIVKNYQTVTGNQSEDIEKIYANLNEPDKSSGAKLHKTYNTINPIINTTLHIEVPTSNELYPGNVYEIQVSDYKKNDFLSTYLKKIAGNHVEYRFVELEVSPICDFAQEKWQKSRRVSGLLVPVKYYDERERKPGENFYWVHPSFELGGEIYKMVFNQRLFKSLDLEKAREKAPAFRIKRELLLDVIAHLSAHINRPGIMFVE